MSAHHGTASLFSETSRFDRLTGVEGWLRDGIGTIGLNVKSDNVAAIRCYRKIGLEVHSRCEEFLVHRAR